MYMLNLLIPTIQYYYQRDLILSNKHYQLIHHSILRIQIVYNHLELGFEVIYYSKVVW